MNHTTNVKCAVIIAIGTAAVPCAAYTQDADTWQMRRLFEPSATHVSAETRGSVMIYEGLEETTRITNTPNKNETVVPWQ